jgi:hypothetical protein
LVCGRAILRAMRKWFIIGGPFVLVFGLFLIAWKNMGRGTLEPVLHPVQVAFFGGILLVTWMFILLALWSRTMRALDNHPILVGLGSILAAALLFCVAGWAAMLALMDIGFGGGPSNWLSSHSDADVVALISCFLIGVPALVGAGLYVRLLVKVWHTLNEPCRPGI